MALVAEDGAVFLEIPAGERATNAAGIQKTTGWEGQIIRRMQVSADVQVGWVRPQQLEQFFRWKMAKHHDLIRLWGPMKKTKVVTLDFHSDTWFKSLQKGPVFFVQQAGDIFDIPAHAFHRVVGIDRPGIQKIPIMVSQNEPAFKIHQQIERSDRFRTECGKVAQAEQLLASGTGQFQQRCLNRLQVSVDV